MADSRQSNDNGNVSKEVEGSWKSSARRSSSVSVSPGRALHPVHPAGVDSTLNDRQMLVGDSADDANQDVVFDCMNLGIVDA